VANVPIYLYHARNEDPRRYNEPVRAADMAIVFNAPFDILIVPYLTIYPIGDQLQRLHPCSPYRDPLTYPLYFIHGEFGKYYRKLYT
jgi:hypothetical protein